MATKRPNIYAHCSYIGTSGYNNHTRNFFRALSDYFKIKVRNFTVGTSWTGLNNTPHDTEPYLDKLDKEFLTEQTLWGANKQLEDHQIYSEYGEILEHDINIVLNETHHHYFYQDYNGPKIAYNVWETTRQPEEFFNKLKDYDQVWVASSWQRDCTIEQGIAPEKVKVVPEAVNGEVFKPDTKASLPDYEDGRFKFVIFGRWDYRKSTKEIIQSFLAEFGKDEPVDLIVSIDNKFARDGLENTEARLKEYKLEDPRIKIIHFPTDQEYVKYLQKGHVFLSCARAEGWNLPLIEAMACGTPSIYSNCSAQLQFAEGKGLPVKITGKKPAIMGEYSTYSQSDMTGEFYTPDYEDLKKVMRDAYKNYDKHKKQALKESKEIRDKFTWERAAQIAGNHLIDFYNSTDDQVNVPIEKLVLKTRLEYKNGLKLYFDKISQGNWTVEFWDNCDLVYKGQNIKQGNWYGPNRKWHTEWEVKILYNNVLVKTHIWSLKDKEVMVIFDSASLGDTIVWMGQMENFKNQHSIKKLYVKTFKNWLFDRKKYRNQGIHLIDKFNDQIKTYYNIGIYYSEEDPWNRNEHKYHWNKVPIAKTAADRLGIHYIENRPLLAPKYRKGSQAKQGKSIVIATQSTAQAKYWNNPSGWQDLIHHYNKSGYKVLHSSKEGTELKGIQQIPFQEDLVNVARAINNANLFIGISSGLTWFAWALKAKTVIISGFTDPYVEFEDAIYVNNHQVCHGCWGTHIFDKGDWNWCPVWKDTHRHFECTKTITAAQVVKKIEENEKYTSNRK